MQLHPSAKLSFVILYCISMNVLWPRGVDTELTGFHGEYLGQELPGLKPQPFAPELFSVWSDNGFHLITSILFSPDGKELFFTNQTLPVVPGCSCSVWYMQQRNNTWIQPRVAPFSGNYSDNVAYYSHDGDVLYFVSTRPIHGKGAPKDFDIWSVKRKNSHWTEAGRLGYPINTSSNDVGGVVSDDGSMFLSSDRPGGKGGFDVYRSRFVGGQYAILENLGDSVNTGAEEYIICAAPDASFLILYHVDMTDKADAGLYITYRKENGSWTKMKSMGDHINIFNVSSASLSSDGKYLFFLSRGEGIYWLRTDLIEYLKNEDLNVSGILLKTVFRNGLDAALAVHEELKEKRGEYVDINEYLLNQRGHQLLDANRYIEAIALFQINVALFPDSWNAYDSLGEAYLKARQIELAIKSYEKSLVLNPENRNAARILESLNTVLEY